MSAHFSSDLLQDAIDAGASSPALREHLVECAACRAEHAKLAALHAQFKTDIAAPTLPADFNARLFKRIDAVEQARARAKERAEIDFRRRMLALKFDWREFWRRHAGSIVAALIVASALVSSLKSLVAMGRPRFTAVLPMVGDSPYMLVVLGSLTVGVGSCWWLWAKAR